MRCLALCVVLALPLQAMTQEKPTPKKAAPEILPPQLRILHDRVGLAAQLQKMFTKTEEAEFLAAVKTVVHDVSTAGKRYVRDLPVTADSITVRSPVLKTIADRDLSQTFLIVGSGELNTCVGSVICSYSDIKITKATNCVIVAGRIAEIEEAENCVIIAGAAKMESMLGVGSANKVGERGPKAGGDPNILVARSWIVATNISDSIVWGVSNRQRSEDETAAVTITKCNRVTFLTPPSGRLTGTESNCFTYSPPNWSK